MDGIIFGVPDLLDIHSSFRPEHCCSVTEIQIPLYAIMDKVEQFNSVPHPERELSGYFGLNRPSRKVLTCAIADQVYITSLDNLDTSMPSLSAPHRPWGHEGDIPERQFLIIPDKMEHGLSKLDHKITTVHVIAHIG